MTKDSRPNILLIITDQQSAHMMSCAGNPYLKTPAIDSLAASGVRFERAYCTNPICVPSRFSLMTGRFPSEIGLRGNFANREVESIPQYIKDQGMGWLFKDAGYDVAYGGKQHLPKMKAEELGFSIISYDERDELAEVCADFINEDRDKPFLLVASFINPHDICMMALRDNAQDDFEKLLVRKCTKEIETLDEVLKLPKGINEDEFFEKICPPLPDNFEVQDNEPEAVRLHHKQRPFKAKTRELYTEKQWRMHRWAYCRLTEMMDRQIGKVLDALKESGKVEDTVVVFTSDHGDMDGAHRMEHKELLYEEACRIPLIISQPGKTAAGRVYKSHLVSNGLDIIMTLCDYAGIPAPEGLKGKSLKDLAEGKETVPWRSVVPVEGESGRAVITDRYKYVLYDKGENREQLYDLQKDPGEMRNAAVDVGYRSVLEKHREIFKRVFEYCKG